MLRCPDTELGAVCITKQGVTYFTLARRTRRKSERLVSLFKTDKQQHQFYAERLALPFARRARITLRPPTVAIRDLNPWRRLRTSTLG